MTPFWAILYCGKSYLKVVGLKSGAPLQTGALCTVKGGGGGWVSFINSVLISISNFKFV